MELLKDRITSLAEDSEFDAPTTFEYLKMVQESLKSTTAEFKKRGWALTVLIFVSYVVGQSETAKLSFAGLEITDLTILRTGLVVAVVYYFYSLLTAVAYRRMLEEIHDQLFRVLLPLMYRRDLEWFVYPMTPFFVENIFRRGIADYKSKLFGAVFEAASYVVILIPPVYVAYALNRSVVAYGVSNPFVAISILLSVVFVANALFAIPAALAFVETKPNAA